MPVLLWASLGPSVVLEGHLGPLGAHGELRHPSVHSAARGSFGQSVFKGLPSFQRMVSQRFAWFSLASWCFLMLCVLLLAVCMFFFFFFFFFCGVVPCRHCRLEAVSRNRRANSMASEVVCPHREVHAAPAERGGCDRPVPDQDRSPWRSLLPDHRAPWRLQATHGLFESFRLRLLTLVDTCGKGLHPVRVRGQHVSAFCAGPPKLDTLITVAQAGRPRPVAWPPRSGRPQLLGGLAWRRTAGGGHGQLGAEAQGAAAGHAVQAAGASCRCFALRPGGPLCR